MTSASHARSGSHGSTSSSAARPRPPQSHLESAITRLIMATKLLLDTLPKWARRECDEAFVSSVYVRLGNNYNAARAAFAAYHISLTELDSVPDELRVCLEQCLAEEASPAAYEHFLPDVRNIIVRLVLGIKAKKAEYHRMYIEPAAAAGPSASAAAAKTPTPPIHPPPDRHASGRAPRVHGPAAQLPVPPAVASSAPPAPSAQTTHTSGVSAAVVDQAVPAVGTARAPAPASYTSDARLPHTLAERTIPERFQTGPSAGESFLTTHAHPSRNRAELKPPAPPPPPPPPQLHSYPSEALLHGPRKPSVDLVEPSMRALKSQSMLERRASKRYSSYTMGKMGASSSMGDGGGHSSPSSGSATGGGSSRSSRPHAEAARLGTTASRISPAQRSPRLALATLTETDDTMDSPADAKVSLPRIQHASTGLGIEEHQPAPSSTVSTVGDPATSRRVHASSNDASATDSHSFHSGLRQTLPNDTLPPDASPELDERERQIQVYAQLGQMTKKASLDLASDPDLTIARLRMIFVDKFAYSPGQDDFPPIYVRPRGTDVEYELEDLADVRDGTVLSLHIDPLDQVKKYLDSCLNPLAGEVRDLKTSLHQRQAQPTAPPSIPLEQIKTLVAETVRAALSTQQQQQQHAGPVDSSAKPAPTPPDKPKSRQIRSTPLHAHPENSTSESNHATASELQRHYLAVKYLRQEMAVMKQEHEQASSQVQQVLSGLRGQNDRVKKLFQEGAPVERSHLDASKAAVDNQSQQVLTLVEDLQDTVDELRVDVIQRKVRPKPALLSKVRKDIQVARAGLDQLSSSVDTVRPSWKKTWEQQLSMIMDEQKFLHHQEQFLADLREDHEEVSSLFGQIQQVLQLSMGPPGKGKAGSGGTESTPFGPRTALLRPVAFEPPPPDSQHQGISTVMLEVAAQDVDHARRVQALEQAEQSWAKARAQAHQPGKFARQLETFVHRQQLRATGGVAEAERVRQQRDEMTRMAMLSGDPNMAGGAPVPLDMPGEQPPKRMIWGGGGEDDDEEEEEEEDKGGKERGRGLKVGVAT